MHELTLKQNLVLLIGFSCASFFFLPSYILPFFENSSEIAGYQLWTTVLFMTITLGAVALFVFADYLMRFFENYPTAAFLTMLGPLVGYALMAATQYQAFLFPLMALGAIILGLSYCMLMAGWMITMTRLGLKTSIGLVILATMIFGVFTMIPFPHVVREVLCFVIPTISAICWRASVQPELSEAPERYDVRPYIAMILLFFLFLICGRIIIGLNTNLLRDYPSEELVLRGIIIVALMVYFLFSFCRRSVQPRLANQWFPVMILFIAADLLFMVWDNAFIDIASGGLLNGTLQCIKVLMYVAFLFILYRSNYSPIRVIAVGILIIDAVPYTVQRVITTQAVSLLGITTDTFNLIIMFIILVSIASLLWYFSRRSGEAMVREAAGFDQGTESSSIAQDEPKLYTKDEVCDIIGHDKKLSPREMDVFRLIVDGNTMQKIADMLNVAYSTVQTHSRSVYKKFDIHSRQELLDYVNEQMKLLNRQPAE